MQSISEFFASDTKSILNLRIKKKLKHNILRLIFIIWQIEKKNNLQTPKPVFMAKKLLFLLAFLTSIYVSKAQNSLEKGWNYFMENDLVKARESFTKATTNSTYSKEAWLSLAMVNSMDKDQMEVFRAFNQFYNLEKDPNPYLYALWHDEFVTGGSGYLNKEVFKFVNSLITDPKINSTVKAYALYSLGSHFESMNKYDKADEFFGQIGAIMKWQFLGSFDNISESGFDKDFGALAHPESSYEFVNYIGAKVKWFKIPEYRPGRWLRFGNHIPAGNSIIYAQTFVKSPKDQEVQFRLGVSGSVKVWVNDVLMFQEKDERNNGIDAYIFTVKLEKGNNRVLLQIGESDDVDGSNFMLRITDQNGSAIEGLLYENSEKTYPKEYSYTSKVIPHFAETFFLEKVKAEPKNILNNYLLARYFLQDDKTYEARKVILKNLENAPVMSFIENQLMSVYIREDAETLLSLELEKVRKNDPKNSLSLSMEIDEMMDKKDYDKAAEYIKELEKVLGETPATIEKRINLLLAEKKTKEAVDMINDAYEKFPDNGTIVDFKRQVAEYVDKDVDGAISILKKYLKTNWNASDISDLADFYFEKGDVDGGLKLLQEIASNISHSAYYQYNIGQIYNELQQYSTAIEYFKTAIARGPYFSSYHASLAQSYKELNKYDLAQKEYETSLILNPNNYEARRTYRKMIDKKAVFTYFQEPDLYKLFEKAPKADEYSDDNSVIIHNEYQRVIYDGGGAEEKRFLLVKVFNASGVDDWKEYDVYADNIEKAEVLKKNGSRLKAEISSGHIVFTNLEEGDGILLIYTNKSSNYSKMIKLFWGSHYFQGYYPYKTNKYSLLIQGDQPFKYNVLHSDLKPQISKPDDEFTLYSWQVEETSGIKSEDYMPDYCDFLPMLQYSNVENWEYIRSWYYDIYRTKTKADFEVKDAIETIFKDKKNVSDEEKVRMIYEYIVRNIRYSSVSFRQSGIVPQKAKKTINTRLGDCKDVSTLFIALCKEVGITAEMMLVNTRNYGEEEMFYPGYNFNHAIAKVYLGKKIYYVELTSDMNPFGTMGQNLRKAFALEIHDGSRGVAAPAFIDTKDRVRNASEKHSVVTFQEDKMLIKRTNVMFGDYSAYRRSNYRDIGKSKREKEIAKEIGDQFAKVKLLDNNFDTTLYLLTDSMVYTYNMEVSDYYTTYKDDQLFKIPLANRQKTVKFINDDKRKYDFNFWSYINDDYEKEVVEIIIPANKILVEIPKDIIISCKYADYSMKFKKVGNTLFVTRQITYKEDKVSVTDFKTFSDFYSKVIKADNDTQLGFKNAPAKK